MLHWLSDVPGMKERPLGGLVGGAVAYALAKLDRAWIVVATREDADRTVRALRYHGASAVLYPADDDRPFDTLSPDPAIPRQRILARAHGHVVVAPAKALMLRVPAELDRFEVRVGQVLERRALVTWLLEHGYLATQRVEEPGCFAVHGAVLEVWAGEGPVRVEWFDDEVESIRDAEKRVRHVHLLPEREARLSPATAERAAAYLHAVAKEREGVGNDRRRVLTDLRNGIWFGGAEDYLPALGDLVPLSPTRPLYVVEPDAVRTELHRFEEQIRARFAALDPEDRPLVRPFDRYLTADEAPLAGAISVTALVHGGGADLGTHENRALRARDTLAPVTKQLVAWAREGRAVTLVANDTHRAERMRALLDLPFREGRAGVGEIGLDVGDLPEGFHAEDVAFVTADEIFGEHRSLNGGEARATPTFRKAAVASFAGVKPGDLVVHARHGVGQYAGLARMPLGEVAGDFVTLAYRDGQKLYVPVHRLDLVTPWRAVGEGGAPRLDKLGGATWEARRAKVRDAVLALAHELLRIHARRKIVTAPAFGPGDTYEARFAETFPFVETPDQEAAIDEVLADLEKDEPMDRLVVGDVGFGKTEIAMRAAMRVVEGGAQVAILCPTTVLATQHHETFRRRFEGFPVRIELLSRFRSGAESARVAADAKAGRVDVLIGTTKMLGREVRFAKLGLVVVDEEHRFGVKQKESLKRMATGAHYLAMTATPIPRSLQMSLAGIRSMSLLTTAPQGRHAIRTEVVRFARERVREDVMHELRRGGQVFFVHNRVQSIEGVADWLRALVPEATVDVAHGQMDDDRLERAFVRFVRQETNVLVCTTIIESGVDIPTVNTMIVNRASDLGLAQLYQLRGRIGRSGVRAVCTLLVSGAGEMRREAAARLRALQENSELGSNFTLASADLELRGGGELLGDRQHGHIAAIGFDAYLELLEEAVAVARGEEARQEVEPEIEVPAPAWIGEDYVPELGERLDFYQRFARARSSDEVRRVSDELERRYGSPPPEAVNLGWLAAVRVRCRSLGVERLAVLKVRAVATLHARTRTDALLRCCAAEPGRFRQTGERALEMRFTPEEAQHPFRVLEFLLARLDG